MNYRIEYSRLARQDVQSIVDYISLSSPTTAHRFIGELQDRIQRKLSTFPMSGAMIGQVRYTTFGNYVIVYRVDEAAGAVTVLMVTEGHRNWRSLFDE